MLVVFRRTSSSRFFALIHAVTHGTSISSVAVCDSTILLQAKVATSKILPEAVEGEQEAGEGIQFQVVNEGSLEVKESFSPKTVSAEEKSVPFFLGPPLPWNSQIP